MTGNSNEITTELIKQLRDKTGISVMQCKKALDETGGDMEKAIMLLQKKSADIASSKQDRTLNSGVVASYIHATGSVGTMVELLCETDFVANNEEFKKIKEISYIHLDDFV
jgi:elongation factor Ts